MRALLRAAVVAGLLVTTMGSSGCPGCAGVNPRPDGHATCSTADAHRATLGCKFQDGFFARCSAIGSSVYNDCVAAAKSCGEIDTCDPAKQ